MVKIIIILKKGGSQKMSKRNIIFICVAVAVVIIIAFIVYFMIINNNDSIQEIYNTKKITITKYDENFEVEKTIEVTKSKKIKEFKQICNSISLEEDNITSQYAVRNDVKIDLNNGTFFMIQLDLEDYCYIENSNSNIYSTIKMPEDLLNYVNSILEENV